MLRRSDTKHGKDKDALVFHAEVQLNLFKVNANRAQDKINADLFLRASIAESYNDKTLYESRKTLIMAFHGLINAR